VGVQDEELGRLESRWRLIAAVVLALAACLVLAAVAWLPDTTPRATGVWDWVYDHHQELAVVVIVAVLALGVVLVASWRRSSWRTLAWGIPSLLIVATVLVGWNVAEDHSNAGDIAGRVHEVTAVLPSSASRTASNEGDNFLTESYVIDDQLDAIAPSLWNSARAQLGQIAGVCADPKEGDSPTYLAMSFRGRNGCDGSVQVNVMLSAVHDMTTAQVSGSCED